MTKSCLQAERQCRNSLFLSYQYTKNGVVNLEKHFCEGAHSQAWEIQCHCNLMRSHFICNSSVTTVMLQQKQCPCFFWLCATEKNNTLHVRMKSYWPDNLVYISNPWSYYHKTWIVSSFEAPTSSVKFSNSRYRMLKCLSFVMRTLHAAECVFVPGFSAALTSCQLGTASRSTLESPSNPCYSKTNSA